MLHRAIPCYIADMIEQATQPDEHAEDIKVHPGIRSYVTDDAGFQAHVQRGRESAKAGPNRSLESVDREVQRLLSR